jgi:hypothetical protein
VLRKLYGDRYTTLFRGGYTGMPAIVNDVWGGDPQATYDGLRHVTGAPAETQVLVATKATPRQVFIDGRPVAATTGPLTDKPVGWTIRPGPSGGILVKLRPHAGFSSVSITLG